MFTDERLAQISALGKATKKHGHTRPRTPEYRAFMNAKTRCENPRCEKYPIYGARGIRVLFASFEQFLVELGRRPSPAHSVDRIDNDGHYAPGNVRWATRSEQRMNQRKVAA